VTGSDASGLSQAASRASANSMRSPLIVKVVIS
jgi:hypothetical protein